MKKIIVAGALAAAAAAGTARADVIWSFEDVAPAAPGQWNWTYSLRVTTDFERMRRAGDFAAVIDFPGYVPASALWTSSGSFTGALVTENTSANVFLAPDQSDDPALPNFRVTNAGSTVYAPGAPQTLGTLRLTSTAGGQAANNLDFYTQAFVERGDSTSEIYLSGVLPGPVPEPSTYAMLAAGLLGLGFVARRRARR